MQYPAQSPFQGIWIPLVTPFADGAVDLPALRRLVRDYKAAGVDGLVACGSTGEAAALDEAEQLAVLDAVLEEAGALPVAMGLAGNHQDHVLRRLARLGERPLAGVLAPAPLILYDIPYRTGAQLDTATLLALAEHPNIAAVKDCGGSVDKTLALIAHGGMAVLAGEDLQGLGTLCLGGTGMIAAAAHVRPDLFVAMHRAVRAQQLGQAQRLFLALAPVIRLLFAEPNPAPLKALLASQGRLRNEMRAPMLPAAEALTRRLQAELDVLDRAFAPGA
ncbi:dihydrodipicolinate synthase [Bordetella pertussis]|nr:4-hydroxy-tetrahydrodipicolinate synthase [Bordetella pertussis]ETH40512.1 dihydrodipicolinate synthetase domain protein [Bordetella pertussis H918]ETH44546.1 dihydrodipicolinate synthetase domain protein [Bordetella pertussis H939]ETH48814.1 dihydrodipicolinate synthetase domain protein [Bordetella pertussis H921]ETH72524.1 dihydrodipicolinate synthetase domain protein [Bordetella pertussis STO1-CHLA-0011]ETH81302.1 dihydrodipicolinate synthetase domain protein [Bordetella pertussis STO1-C